MGNLTWDELKRSVSAKTFIKELRLSFRTFSVGKFYTCSKPPLSQTLD